MNELDRILNDVGSDEMEFEQEFEFEYEGDDEFEFEYEEDDEFEFEFEGEFESEYEMGDDDDTEMAYELLAVESDEELDQFLGSIFKAALPIAKRLGGAALRRVRRPFVRKVKSLGRRFLPNLGRTAGNLGCRAGRAVGRRVGGRLSKWASRRLGLEMESMEPQEMEFEMAKALIKVAKTSAKTLGKAAAKGAKPSPKLVNKAIKVAMNRHFNGKKRGGSQAAGRWVRKGRNIVLMGVR